MGEAIGRRNAGDVIEASSAGLAPLGFVAEMTIKTLLRNGYPVEGLGSKPVLREAWEAADIVINMSGRARELAFREYARVEDWAIEDPYGDHPETYQRTSETTHRPFAQLPDKQSQ